MGRAWIEGLRTDSLYLFDWTIFGEPIRVSQMLSVVLCIAALFVMIYQLKVKKPSRENLYVNRIKARGDAESGN